MAKKPSARETQKQKREAVSLNKLTLTEADFDPSVIAEVKAKLANADLDTESELTAVPPVELKPLKPSEAAFEILMVEVTKETPLFLIPPEPSVDPGVILQTPVAAQDGSPQLETSSEPKPNGATEVTNAGESETEQVVESLRIKPAMLTDEADDQRKTDLAEAYKKSQKDGRRMNLVAGHKFVETRYVGRDANSVSRDEYVIGRDAAYVALPPEAGDYQFTQEANSFVQSRGPDLKSAICEFFKGRYNIALEEIRDPATWEKILMLHAKIFVASRPQGKKAVKIDADSPVHCQSSPDCARLFVPLSWLEYNREKNEETWTGNVLITRDGDQKWYCTSCRSIGRKHGVPFYSVRSAEKVAGRIRQDSRRESGVLASLKDVAGYHDSHEKREDRNGQQPGRFNQELADRNKNLFSSLLNNKEKNHPEGRYYSPEFERDTKLGKVQTFLDLRVSRHMLTVNDAGPGLEHFKGKNFNTGFFENKAFLSALYQAAEAQQKS